VRGYTGVEKLTVGAAAARLPPGAGCTLTGDPGCPCRVRCCCIAFLTAGTRCERDMINHGLVD
jgi:hypothetical protein